MDARLAIPLSAVALIAGSWLVLPAASSAGEPSSAASPAASVDAAMPKLALIATRGGRSELYLTRPGDGLGKPLLHFSHLPEGNLRARALPGGSVLATAPVTAGRDVSFNGALLRLEPSSGQVLSLCSGVSHASRPLVSPRGRVFVERGAAGPAQPSELRVDALTIDEVDPASGTLRTIHSLSGYVLHLAGWHDGEVLLYRVAKNTSDIVAVDPDTLAVRTVVASLPPFARDFSVGDGKLVYRGRHQSDIRSWVVDSVDLDSGAVERLYSGHSFAIAPHAWPGGGVAINPAHSGLELLGSADTIHQPLGPGVDVALDVSRSGRFVALLHTRRGRAARPFVIDRGQGSSHVIATIAGGRMAIAGFIEGPSP